MTDEELDRLEQVALAFEPKSWVMRYDSDRILALIKPEDAEFAMGAGEDMVTLIAEVRRLRQQVPRHAERIAAQSELLSRKAEK